MALLRSEEEQLQAAATGALSQLAENPVCQQMISAAGALEPLTKMASYGSDYHKLGALNALEVIALAPMRTPPHRPVRMCTCTQPAL